MKKVTIVILNWNGREHLKTYLPRVVAHSNAELCKIVVADNGSTDDSCSYVREHFPEVLLWKFDQNYGFAGNQNIFLWTGFYSFVSCFYGSNHLTTKSLD